MSSQESSVLSKLVRLPRLQGYWGRLWIRMVVHEYRFSRASRRQVWDPFYSVACNDFLPRGLVSFLNVGYLADSNSVDTEDDLELSDRLSERLYDQVVGEVDLEGRFVVEVGCGPGAGSAYLARTRRPASFLGVDLNADLIAWCKEHHDDANLQFQQGDAQDLPVESESIDAVVNVESSHCYPSRLGFFEEVMRILRPGGSFLLADFIFSVGQSEDDVSAQLAQVGFVVEDRIDITKNVLAARDLVSSSAAFRSLIRERVPPQMLAETEHHMFLTGTTSYERLVSGKVRYVQWRASKPSD